MHASHHSATDARSPLHAEFRDDVGAARPAIHRAGLRRPTDDQPTGVFVVIEMAVLVIVCALAMVSIIVSTTEDSGGAAPGEAVMTEQGLAAVNPSVAAATPDRIAQKP